MKKIITPLLMLALVISLMAAFTSCGEPAYEKLPADERAIELDKLSSETNRSRNELINILLDYAIENCEVK